MKTQNPIGSVVSLGRFGPAVITEAAYGPKYTTYKWVALDAKKTTGWAKMPARSVFWDRYKFIKTATKAQMDAACGKIQEVRKTERKRIAEKVTKMVEAKLCPGDIVRVRYTDAVKDEVVLDVDYRTGKFAIVRDHLGAERVTKRRMLPATCMTQILHSGGGMFDPNNPLYTREHMFIPDFYKQGKVVGTHRKTRKPTPWYL